MGGPCRTVAGASGFFAGVALVLVLVAVLGAIVAVVLVVVVVVAVVAGRGCGAGGLLAPVVVEDVTRCGFDSHTTRPNSYRSRNASIS